MAGLDIVKQRLINQHIVSPKFQKPEDVVKWLGAVQSQDYAGAKWAIGLRLQNSSDAAIDDAMAEGSIIRTHVLRPTWHFVSPADVRWMIELTAPRVNAFCASMFRKLQLDTQVFKRSNDALAKALMGGKQVNRAEMIMVLNNAGVPTNDLRFIHLLIRAELDKVICSGGRQGKQFTYALFDDRVPKNNFSKEEALEELARRYFKSRGPATLPDFTWWSGLATVDAKAALEMAKTELVKTVVGGVEYWSARNDRALDVKLLIAHLLPAFDEFAIAYKDRNLIVNTRYLKQTRNVIFDPSVVVDNQIAGTWKRTISKTKVDITLNLFDKINKTQTKAVEAAMDRYRNFIIPKK